MKWIRRVTTPLLDLLRQGVTPEKLALSLALGICISCFPLFGATTTFCALAAVLLRLNLPAIQLANYAAAPLQLILILPFIRLGEHLFGSEHLPLSAHELAARFRAFPWKTLASLWQWEWHAMIAWLLAAAPAVLVLHLVLRALLRRMSWLEDAPLVEPE